MHTIELLSQAGTEITDAHVSRHNFNFGGELQLSIVFHPSLLQIFGEMVSIHSEQKNKDI